MSDETVLTLDAAPVATRWSERVPTATPVPNPTVMRIGRKLDALAIDWEALHDELLDAAFRGELAGNE